MPASDKTACPVCGEGETRVLLKEANVSCGDYFEGARLYKEDIGQTPLVKCTGCGFARFCDMHAWQAGTFRGRIYNDDYGRCDPPFEEERPARLAGWLAPLCAGKRLIDYGGGRGRTAQLLRDHDIDAVSYDPFYADALLPDWRADIVTAFEVVRCSICSLRAASCCSPPCCSRIHWCRTGGMRRRATAMCPSTPATAWPKRCAMWAQT